MCKVKILLLAVKVIKDKGIVFEEEKTVPVPFLEDGKRSPKRLFVDGIIFYYLLTNQYLFDVYNF